MVEVNKMKFALKIGGSLLFKDDNSVNIVFLEDLIKVLRKIKKLKHDIIIIIGGGKIARNFIEIARNFNASEENCDQVGIYASRLNAMLIASIDPEIFHQEIPVDVDTAIIYLTDNKGKFIVMGGVIPGQSTNAVAAEAAEQLKADAILNATDVDYVYSADPKVDPNAKPLKKISYGEFSKLIDKDAKAGKYKLFDYRAFKIIERSKIKTYMFSGKDPENIFKIINGEKIGTIISS
ncbi:MAG: UMP kinase [Candidatus Lokiarchaeota archaeon]|nr:UMP kinase [Candidatus Lokiarchaeota archaeon]